MMRRKKHERWPLRAADHAAAGMPSLRRYRAAHLHTISLHFMSRPLRLAAMGIACGNIIGHKSTTVSATISGEISGRIGVSGMLGRLCHSWAPAAYRLLIAAMLASIAACSPPPATRRHGPMLPVEAARRHAPGMRFQQHIAADRHFSPSITIERAISHASPAGTTASLSPCAVSCRRYYAMLFAAFAAYSEGEH